MTEDKKETQLEWSERLRAPAYILMRMYRNGYPGRFVTNDNIDQHNHYAYSDGKSHKKEIRESLDVLVDEGFLESVVVNRDEIRGYRPKKGQEDLIWEKVKLPIKKKEYQKPFEYSAREIKFPKMYESSEFGAMPIGYGLDEDTAIAIYTEPTLERARKFEEALRSLPPREVRIIELYFGLKGRKENIKQISELLGITSGRVNSLLYRGLNKLYDYSPELKRIIDDSVLTKEISTEVQE